MAESIDQQKKNRVLLIIDPQNDFVDIPETFNKRIPKDSPNPFDQISESAGLPVGPATKEQNLYFAPDFSEDKKEPINGAKADLDKLAGFLAKNGGEFDEIHVSLDSHTKNHIGHIGFWKKKTVTIDGKDETRPRPLQQFYVKPEGTEPQDGKYHIYVKNFNEVVVPGKEVEIETSNSDLQEWAYRYILKMQNLRKNDNSKPEPCLWAEHCIISDEKNNAENGWMVYEPLSKVLDELQKTNKEKGKNKVFYHEKGTNDLVEMYSIFSAEVPYEKLLREIEDINPGSASLEYIKNIYLKDKVVSIESIEPNTENKPNKSKNYNTEFNEKLFKKLTIDENGVKNKIFVCGEAKSHCVKTSLEDMLKKCDEIGFPKNKIYMFDDMSSIINAYAESSIAAYEKMKGQDGQGLQIIKSEDFEKIILQIGGKRRNKTTKKSKATKKSKKSSKTTRKHRKTHKSKR
jgi:hypothetical protein